MHIFFENTRRVIPGLHQLLTDEGYTYRTSKVNSKESPNLECVEMTGINFTIADFDDIEATLRLNGFNPMFAEKDFLDRISPNPVNPGNAIKFDNTGVLKLFLNDQGLLDYTYSERLHFQYEYIIKILLEDPFTRQAYMSVWDPCIDAVREGARVPCSLGYHFLYRNDMLNLNYSMRSLDILKCLGYDMYTSYRLLKYIAGRAGMSVGYITFMVGSLHYYRRVKEEN